MHRDTTDQKIKERTGTQISDVWSGKERNHEDERWIEKKQQEEVRKERTLRKQVQSQRGSMKRQADEGVFLFFYLPKLVLNSFFFLCGRENRKVLSLRETRNAN